MNMSDGSVAFLLALGVAGLAVGAAVAAHGGLPEASPSPSSSPLPFPTQDALSDDICVLMDEMAPLAEDMRGDSIVFDILAGAADENDPAVLEALHDEGQDILDGVESITSHLSRASEVATDPEAADAFETLVRMYEELNEPYGRAAKEAESVESFVSEITASTFITGGDTLSKEGDQANLITGQYVLDTCGRDILDVNFFASQNAELDTATLALGIATYYVESEVDASPPLITASEDEYLINDSAIGTRSPGVSLTDQQINDWDDWCVEVTSEYGLKESFIATYAEIDVTKGTCASLTS